MTETLPRDRPIEVVDVVNLVDWLKMLHPVITIGTLAQFLEADIGLVLKAVNRAVRRGLIEEHVDEFIPESGHYWAARGPRPVPVYHYTRTRKALP